MVRSPQNQSQNPRSSDRRALPWRDLWDVLALGLWSAMLFRYWFTNKLLLLLHPNYSWLSNSAAIVLAFLALYRLWSLLTNHNSAPVDGSHITLLPKNLSSFLLTAIAVFGLIYTPRAFASQTAEQRGIADTLTLTRAQPQRFARAAEPESRTIIDWIRLVNVYPEPDAYTDEPVSVEGFVISPEGWPDNFVMVSRFVLTCCAADAYPVGLPVKLESAAAAEQYPVDSWVSVTGSVVTETLDNRRQIVIAPTEVRAIEEPPNPYEY